MNSYIHVDDFPSAKHLAEYLNKLDANDTLYNSYFRWKGTGEFVNTFFWCRLCAMLHDSFPIKSYSDINEWWRGGTCTTGSWRKKPWRFDLGGLLKTVSWVVFLLLNIMYSCIVFDLSSYTARTLSIFSTILSVILVKTGFVTRSAADQYQYFYIILTAIQNTYLYYEKVLSLILTVCGQYQGLILPSLLVGLNYVLRKSRGIGYQAIFLRGARIPLFS